jgi:hypothetical protein
MDNEAVSGQGIVEQIGLDGANITHRWGENKKEIKTAIPNHSKAIALVIEVLTDRKQGSFPTSRKSTRWTPHHSWRLHVRRIRSYHRSGERQDQTAF